jgi:uncharacterized repeat protein (TIGR02543 family)
MEKKLFLTGMRRITMCGMGIILAFAMMLAGCSVSVAPDSSVIPDGGAKPVTGTITGKALFTGQETDQNGGITITLESLDNNGRSAAVQSVNAGEERSSAAVRSITAARSIAGQTTTASDGSYSIKDVPYGTYTIYASSNNSKERAISLPVTLEGSTVTADDLKLTAVGSIGGTITLDGTPAFGFLVSIAGTSWMAITDYNGAFVISDIPAAAEKYLIVVMKGNYTGSWDSAGKYAAGVTVEGGKNTDLTTKELTAQDLYDSADIRIDEETGNWFINGIDTGISAKGDKGDQGDKGDPGVGIVWKGELATAPEYPELNWAYYNTADRKSYIYDGNAWQTLAVDGEDGSILFTVTFDSNGGSDAAPIPVISGGTIPLPKTTKAGNTFDGWYTDNNSFENAFTSLTVVSTNVTVYAKWIKVYELGDTGPAGGIIFYKKEAVSDGWRYLEAAPASTEFSRITWGLYGIEVSGTQKGIGTGKENTQRILEVLEDEGETGRAAQLCDNLDVNEFNDWFLPSIDELNLLYTNLFIKNLGDFTEQATYWSSSQSDEVSMVQYNPWFQPFYEDRTYTDMWGDPRSVRAIRQF